MLLVERTSDGAQDGELPGLLRGAVPDGTPVRVNRVAGRTRDVGAVAG